jgi:hypothetical protein
MPLGFDRAMYFLSACQQTDFQEFGFLAASNAMAQGHKRRCKLHGNAL